MTTATANRPGNTTPTRIGSDPELRCADGRKMGEDGHDLRLAERGSNPHQQVHATRLRLHLCENANHALARWIAQRAADPSSSLPQEAADECPINPHQPEGVPALRVGQGHGQWGIGKRKIHGLGEPLDERGQCFALLHSEEADLLEVWIVVLHGLVWRGKRRLCPHDVIRKISE